MVITALLQVSPIGHMDPYITDWVTKVSQVPRKFELDTYQFDSDVVTY